MCSRNSKKSPRYWTNVVHTTTTRERLRNEGDSKQRLGFRSGRGAFLHCDWRIFPLPVAASCDAMRTTSLLTSPPNPRINSGLEWRTSYGLVLSHLLCDTWQFSDLVTRGGTFVSAAVLRNGICWNAAMMLCLNSEWLNFFVCTVPMHLLQNFQTRLEDYTGVLKTTCIDFCFERLTWSFKKNIYWF